MIERYGGRYVHATRNIHNAHSLLYTLERIDTELEELPVPEAAARLAFRIVDGHLFIDGNARTGLEAAFLLAELNGHEITISTSSEDVIRVGTALSEDSDSPNKMTLDELMAWFGEICVAQD